MNWFKKLFKRKNEDSLDPLKTNKVQFLGRVLYPYKAQCTLVFNGKPVRTFESTIKAESKHRAVKKLNEGYKVEVTKINRIKR
jgi:hypothetical protein